MSLDFLDNIPQNGAEYERARMQSQQQDPTRQRVNAERAEQLHQQRMMLRAAQATGHLPYNIQGR